MNWHPLPQWPGNSACLLHTAQEVGLAGFSDRSLMVASGCKHLGAGVAAVASFCTHWSIVCKYLYFHILSTFFHTLTGRRLCHECKALDPGYGCAHVKQYTSIQDFICSLFVCWELLRIPTVYQLRQSCPLVCGPKRLMRELSDLPLGSRVVVQAALCTRKDQWAQGVKHVKGWMWRSYIALYYTLYVCVGGEGIKAEF